MKNRTNLSLVLVAILCVFGSYSLPVESVQGEGHNDFVFLLAEDGNGLYNLGGSQPNPNGDSTKVRTLESGGVKFKIPSYASGIMDITKPQFDGLPETEKPNGKEIPLPNLDLLPPVDDGDRNGPNPTSNEIPGSTTQKSVQQFPVFPISGSTIGSRIGEDNVYDLALDLLPPLPSDDKIKNYKPAFPIQQPSRAPVGTSTAIQPAKPSQPEQRFGASFSFSSPTTASSKPAGAPPTSILPTKQPQPDQRFGSSFSFNIPTTASSKSIYTGGFGGAPGILGDQKKPGYAIRPDGSIRDPGNQKTTAKPFVPIVTTRPPPPVVRPVTPVAAKPVANKYTGSFGGPPGVLSPFDRPVPAGTKAST